MLNKNDYGMHNKAYKHRERMNFKFSSHGRLTPGSAAPTSVPDGPSATGPLAPPPVTTVSVGDE